MVQRRPEMFVPVEEQSHSIPNNWQWVRLMAVCNDFIVPQRDKPKKFSGSIPWCRIEDIEGKYLNGTKSGQYVSEETIKEMNLRVCPVGTVICSCSASLGVQAILTTQCCTNQTFIGLVCSDLIRNEYLYFYLQSLEEYWQQIGTGTTIKYISRNKFEMLNTPLPPLPEQQRIVDRIESLFAKLDEAKEKAQAVVDGFEDRKAAILHKAFTGELTAEWRKNKGVSLSSWTYEKIGEFAKVRGGKRLPKGYSLQNEKTEHPYIRIADLGESTVNQANIQYISDEVYQQISRYIIEDGDVYISIVGTIGKSGTIPSVLNGANLTENAARISTTRTLPRYLASFLNSPAEQEDIQGRIRSATLGKLSLYNINDITVPLPSKNEQQVVVDQIDKLFALENSAKEAAEQVISQIDTMKKAILARAFRGELGTNDPTEPPIVVGG